MALKSESTPNHSQRFGSIIAVIGLMSFVTTAVGFVYFAAVENVPALFNAALIQVPNIIVWLYALWMIRQGKMERGIQVGLFVMLVTAPLNALVLSGLGAVTGLATVLGVAAGAGLVLPPMRAQQWIGGAVVSGLASFLVDFFGAPNRVDLAVSNTFTTIVVFVVLILLLGLIAFQFRNFSLRTKLITALVGLTALSAITVTYFASQALQETLRANAARDLRTRAQSAALAIGLTMDRNVDRLQTMSLDKRVQDELTIISDSYPALEQERDELIARNSARWANGDAQDTVIRNALTGQLAFSLRQFGDVFQGNKELFITDRYGSVVAATEWQPTYNFSQFPWWQIAYGNGRGGVYIGQPEFSTMTNEYGVRIAIPIFAPGRERVVGVLHGVYTMTALQRALLLNSFGRTGKMDLLFPEGAILTSEGVFRTLTSAEFAEIKDGINQPLAVLNYRGVPLLASQGVLGVSDEQPEPYLRSSAWRTIATVEADEVLAAVDTATRAALLTGLATIAGAVLFALLLAQFLTRPIRRLTNAAQQVQEGDLAARAPVETSDEIGTLAITFNNMTARLQDTLAGLERRVAERTQELSNANLTLQSNSAYLSALSDTSAGLFERLNLTELLQAIVERAGALVGTENGFVFFAEPGESEIEMRVGSGLYDDLVGTRAQRGVGLAGSVWQTGEPMIIDDYQKWAGRLPGSRRDALRAIVAVPLARGAGKGSADDETVGVIGLAYTDAERKFGKTQVEILQRFAQLASIALDNAQLYATSENRVQELGALNSISRIVAQESDLMQLVEKTGDQVCRIFDTDFAYIALFDAASERIEFPYVIDNGKRIQIESLNLGQGLTSQVITSRQPLLLTNANEDDYTRLGAVDSGDGASPVSLLSVPMFSGDNVLGVLSVQRTGIARNLTPEDQRLLTTIAATIAVGIENTRLAQATTRQLEELSALNRISASLTTDKPLVERLGQVGNELHTIFGVSSVYIALYDAANNMVQMPFFMGDDKQYAIDPFELGPGFTSHIIKTRAPLMINNDMHAQLQTLQALQAGEGDVNESYLGVPIVVGEQVLGVIGLSDQPKNKFHPSDVNLLTTISSAIGAAMQNARLLEQTQERARELDAVNSLAREITQQRSLDDLFKEVYMQVRGVIPADGLLISLYDERTDMLTVPFLMDEGARYEITPDALVLEREYADQVRLGEPIIVNSTPEEVAELEKSPAVAGGGRASRSRLYVPLMAGLRFLGMISLHSYKYNAYTQRDAAILTGLAAHIAIALENARLFEQTQGALSDTNRLYRIAEAANTAIDENAFYKRVHEIVGEVVPAKNFLIALYNADDGTMDMVYFVDEQDTLPEMPLRRINVGTGITAYVLRTRQPLLATKDDIHALAEKGALKLHGGQSEMWLGVPMMRGDQPLGVIAVQSYDARVRYTERDKQTLINLSQGIANAIERLRAEAALRRTETQLVEALRITRLGNWEYDFVNDIFSFTDAFYDMMRTTAQREGGYTMSSAQYAERFVHPEDLPLVGAEIAASVETTDPNFRRELEHRVTFGDGEPGYVSVRFRIEKDEKGRTVKSYGANLDITERKRAELDLQRAFEETQRLARQARESADQVSALNRRLTREGWREYLEQLDSRLVVEAGAGQQGNGRALEPTDLNGGARNGERGNGGEKIQVPIILRGEVIGEIELEPEDDANALSDEDLGLVTHVAENIGLALDNARLFTETQRRVTELDALNQISQAVTTELDLDSLLNLIGEQVRSIFDVQNTYIALYDRAKQEISLPYFVNDNERVAVDPLPYGEGITSLIIRNREPLVINSDAQEVMAKMGAKVFGNPAQSYLGVPIFVGDEVTGVISVQSTSRAGIFDESNVRLMETIAATVGAAIQNAQLYGAMQQEVVTRQRAEEEIKLSLKEKEVLLKEIHHRVKNNLQIITSLLNLQSAQIKDPEAVMLFRESQSRVRSMALIHEKLYQSKDLARIDFDGYVRDLMVYLFRSYAANPDQIRTHIETHNMFLGIDTAIPCGLIISELVTNTIKYAFPDGKRGKLFVGIGPEDDGHLTLRVEDDGVGFPEGFDWRESDSLGLQLVSTLSAQLHGTVEVNGKGGTSFKITFPG